MARKGRQRTVHRDRHGKNPWLCGCGAWKMQDAEYCTTCQGYQAPMGSTRESRGIIASIFDIRKKHKGKKGNKDKGKAADNWVAKESVEEVG